MAVNGKVGPSNYGRISRRLQFRRYKRIRVIAGWKLNKKYHERIPTLHKLKVHVLKKSLKTFDHINSTKQTFE